MLSKLAGGGQTFQSHSRLRSSPACCTYRHPKQSCPSAGAFGGSKLRQQQSAAEFALVAASRPTPMRAEGELPAHRARSALGLPPAVLNT